MTFSVHGLPVARGIAIGRAVQHRPPVAPRLGGIGGVDHLDERLHRVVDVAAERDGARLVEGDRALFALAEQLQFELLRRRERINVVAERIEVGELEIPECVVG